MRGEISAVGMSALLRAPAQLRVGNKHYMKEFTLPIRLTSEGHTI